jgi:hypothetical protein
MGAVRLTWVLSAAAALSLAAAAVRGDDTPPAHNSSTETEPAIYGQSLMTSAEVDAYRERLSSISSGQERESFLRQHRGRMDERARARDVPLQEAALAEPEEEIFGRELMSGQEIEAYRERLRDASPSEREHFLREHRDLMIERARARTAELPPVGSGPSDGHRPPQ